MKLISYNLNGIRSALNKNLTGWLRAENPDILCIQETKAQPDQMGSQTFKNLGYDCFWHSAVRRGYSGTTARGSANFTEVSEQLLAAAFRHIDGIMQHGIRTLFITFFQIAVLLFCNAQIFFVQPLFVE